MLIKRFFSAIYHRYLIFANPSKYADKVGVNLKGNIYKLNIKTNRERSNARKLVFSIVKFLSLTIKNLSIFSQNIFIYDIISI